MIFNSEQNDNMDAFFSPNTAVSSASDLTAAATGYPKSHSQAFDKSGFAAGTPPPYGPMAAAATGLPTGTQAGPMGAGAPQAAYVQYVPGLAAAQPPSAQMLAHQLHQV